MSDDHFCCRCNNCTLCKCWDFKPVEDLMNINDASHIFNIKVRDLVKAKKDEKIKIHQWVHKNRFVSRREIEKFLERENNGKKTAQRYKPKLV